MNSDGHDTAAGNLRHASTIEDASNQVRASGYQQARNSSLEVSPRKDVNLDVVFTERALQALSIAL